jgi:hypothetical protein
VPALRSFGHPAAADLGASPILFRCGSRTTCARGCPPTRPRSGRAGRPPNVHAFFSCRSCHADGPVLSMHPCEMEDQMSEEHSGYLGAAGDRSGRTT